MDEEPDDDAPTPAERAAREAQAFAESIVDTVREPLLVLDEALRVVAVNRSFLQTFRVSEEETHGAPVYELGNGQWDIPALRRLLEVLLPGHTHFDDFEVRHAFPQIGEKVMLLNARKLYRPGHARHDRGNHTAMILLAIEDVTDRRAEEARRRAAYEREHLIAEALQRPLLLEVPEHAFPGVSVATLYEAALDEAQVGGDFFDAFALPRGRVAFAISDASGKGLSAAVRAIQLKDVLKAFAREYPHAPQAIVARLNDFVCDGRRFGPEGEQGGGEEFSCLTLAVFDPERGEGSLVSAGSEPALIVRADGTAEALEVGGLPLGVEREELYLASPFRLAAGDTLVLVTDGITEARRVSPEARAPITEARKPSPEARRGRGDFLGYEGMTALARGALGRGLPTLRDAAAAILEGARAFCGGAALRDDACVVLVRRK